MSEIERNWDPDAGLSASAAPLDWLRSIDAPDWPSEGWSRAAEPVPDFDAVTGLPGVATFSAAFDQITSVRQGGATSITRLELDGFIGIRSAHGPHAADEIMELAAGVLTGVLRSTDVLARWGDGGFVILLPNTECAGAVRAMEKAVRALQGEQFLLSGGQIQSLTASVGVTQTRDSEALFLLDDFVTEADRYLELARVSGGGRIQSREGEVVPAEATILLLEDDPVSAGVISHRLRRKGHRVLHMADGATVMSNLPPDPPSLILLDLNMGGIGGIGAISRIRQMPALRKVPIVVLSKVESETDLVRCFQLGADEYIRKPFSMSELTSRVQRLLRGR